MHPKVQAAIDALVGALTDESIPLEERKAFEGQARARLKKLGEIINTQLRIAEAKLTADDRIKEDEPHYGTHLRHCYPKGGVDGYPTACKYGEDDVCPAALYEDPWVEYLKWKKKVDSTSTSANTDEAT